MNEDSKTTVGLKMDSEMTLKGAWCVRKQKEAENVCKNGNDFCEVKQLYQAYPY